MKKLNTEDSDDEAVSFSQKRFNVKTLHIAIVIVLAFILVIICIVLAVLYSHAVHKARQRPMKTDKKSNEYAICIQEGCFEFGKELALNMNQSVSPCDDFYAYACGGWQKRNPLTNNTQFSSVLYKMGKKNVKVLIKAVESALRSKQQSEAIQKTVRFYNSCMSTSEIDSLPMRLLMGLITKYGGWGVLNNFDSSVSLETRIAKVYRDLGVYSILNAEVIVDEYNSSRNIIKLRYASTTFSSSIYLNKSQAVKKDIQEKIAIFSKLIAMNGTEARLMAIYNFETKLAEIKSGRKTPDEELKASVRESIKARKAIPDHRIKLKDFCVKSGFSCDRLKMILNMTFGRSFSGDEWLLVTNITYFKNLHKLIEDTIASGNEQVISDYVMWHVVYDYMDKSLFLKKSSNSSEPPMPKEPKCIIKMIPGLSLPLGLLYINAVNFQDHTKKKLQEMTDYIKEAFIERLKSQTWMDEKTREIAKEKALGIKEFIAYPSYIKDSKKLDDRYKSLTVTDNYFLNFIALKHFVVMRGINKYGKPVNKDSWDDNLPIFIANAFYNRIRNSMCYLAGMIQPPLYQPGFPGYLKYSGIGMVIGHELTHGFDSSGRQYDKNGNLHDWWSRSSDANFIQKAKCLVDQYSDYNFYNLKIDGNWTKDENIADNGGLQIAYDAYQKWVANHKTEAILPGFRMSPDQLFFLGFAQQWCSIYTEKGVKSRAFGTHTTQKYRVIGSLVNFDKFSEAFGCPANSPMNPSKKCSIW